tara:strand:+ start:155 stop:382 length:228 start_codon:yes stop_codon:yes gene_type:complete
MYDTYAEHVRDSEVDHEHPVSYEGIDHDECPRCEIETDEYEQEECCRDCRNELNYLWAEIDWADECTRKAESGWG